MPLTGQAFLDEAKRKLADQKAAQSAIASRSGASTGPVKASSSSAWLWPTSSRSISQSVGEGHMALDIRGTRGAPVVAPTAGRLDVKYQPEGYGYNVRILTQEGYSIILGHLDAVASGLQSGQNVTQGQLLGLLGSTGHSTGPHIHLEVRGPGYASDRFVPGTSSGIGAIDPRSFFEGSALPVASVADKSTSSFKYAPQTMSSVAIPGGPTSLTSSPAKTSQTSSGSPGVSGSASVTSTPKGNIVIGNTPVGKISIPQPGTQFTRWMIVAIGIILIIAGMVMMVNRYRAASGEAIEKVAKAAVKVKSGHPG